MSVRYFWMEKKKKPDTRFNAFVAILKFQLLLICLRDILFFLSFAEGMKLYISDNKVILTEGFDGIVPVKYFERIETWPGRQPIPFQVI